ncbi:MAG: putative DNA binding domain-containing protein [Anaerolineales bacterium]|nr:putative DNA binding domain-containing protein [Anaerolineales bacterium]
MVAKELFELIAQGEGQRLDFKRGVPSVKDLARAVICLANAEGGKILLGVDDDGRILGCTSYDVPDTLSGIYRATDPPITVDIEEVNTPQGTVLVIHVPRTPFIHSTTGGLFQRRVGKECLPMSASDVLAFQSEQAGLDYTALPLRKARYPDDVDAQALEALRAEIEVRNPALARYADLDLLRSLGLLVDGEDSSRLTVAAGLLLGRPETLRKTLPQAEAAYFRQRTETDIRLSERLYLPLPLLLRRLEELIEADNEVRSFLLGLQRIDVPKFPQTVYREAILNAVAHRNYGLPGNVIVRHFPDRLEVMSPGGFPAGVTPANILRQVVPRNRLLADVLGRVGYVERAGYGVDMMYEELLRLGKESPWFIPDKLSVRVVIRDGTLDEPFVAFVQRRLRSGAPPTLEQLLVLSHLKRHLELDLTTAMGLLQRNEGETDEVLAGMVREGLLERVGAGKAAVYQLTVEVAEQIEVSLLGQLLTPAEQETRVLEYVREQGEITNRECQRLCGLTRHQARHLLARLVEAGRLKQIGQGRWTRYLPA